MDIKGHTVHRVLVDPGAQIEEEYYVSFLLDRANRTLPRDGVLRGRHGDRAARGRAARGAGQGAGRRARPASTRPRPARSRPRRSSRPRSPTRSPTCWSSCGRRSSASDATLVEVNPLAKFGRRQSIKALDGKVTLDDNANFRQPGNADFVDVESTDPLEQQAKEKHLNYVKLDGEVGDHRQRRRPGDVDPGRRGLRR